MRLRIIIISSLLFVQAKGQVSTFQTTYSIEATPAYVSRSNIICTIDGGFVAPVLEHDSTTQTQHLNVIKTDADGNLQWSYELQANVTNQNSYSNAFIAEMSDGGFAIEALIRSAIPNNNTRLVVFRTDAAANVLWQRGFQGDFRAISTILVASDGSIIPTATLGNSSFETDFWSARLDATGSCLWTKTFDLGIVNEESASACYTLNGDVVIAGTTLGPSIDLCAARIDANGNLLWAAVYSGQLDDWAIEVKTLMNGDFLCIGRAGNPEQGGGCYWDIAAVRLGSMGNVVWSWLYGGNSCDEGYGVVENDDGTLTMLCEPESFIGTSQSALMKTTDGGDFLWMKTYNGSMGTFPASLTKTTDGGFAILGVYGIFTSGNSPVFLSKTNEDGELNCGTKSVFARKTLYSLTVSTGATSTVAATPFIENYNWTPESVTETIICELGVVVEHVTAPNVFTPNEDGVNDFFLIDFFGSDSFHIWIYDRWGVLMFETSDQYQHWDGKSMNGSPATDGTYYYVLETDLQGYTGFFTLIR